MSELSVIENVTKIYVEEDNTVLDIREETIDIIEVATQGPEGVPGTIVSVSDIEPTNPVVGDLWVKISE